ncbi:hypothetical protein F503_05896 [Ophiostoma piceae UAMH 11346]|uniref:F-box domain-containing protein n=1 Tax=Ophiostoma piceae (strain UAMH 11346) TaxID=1262450 RepID=S3CFB5_OPHP1|nr:hypothetical protein F503_05896 [Ophiostoma piceae UAMH 11346]
MSSFGTTRRSRRTARFSMDDLRSSVYGSRGAATPADGYAETDASPERINTRNIPHNIAGSAVDDGEDVSHDHVLNVDGAAAQSGAKAFKGIIRRASVSFQGFIQRRASNAGVRSYPGTDDPALSSSLVLSNRLLRSSHVHSQSQSQTQEHRAESRPTTSHNFPSWRRVRQAASFLFEGDTPATASSSGLFDPSTTGESLPTFTNAFSASPERGPTRCDTGFRDPHDSPPISSSAPILGRPSPTSRGPRPPVIPINTGGAARAAAAAAFQNEILQMMQPKWLQEEDTGNDRESGIGITITSESDSADEATAQTAVGDNCQGDLAELAITKVDFVANLPTELAILILSELDATGLQAASRVSQAWNLVAKNQHIWRESFLREKTGTYATSGPVQPGVGLGVPPARPSSDWRQIYRVKHELDRRWQEGKTRPVYLNGHSDSIYCLQFDEQKIITGSRDRTIRIWDMKTLECRLVVGPPDVVQDPKLLHDENGQATHYITTAHHTRSTTSMPTAVSFPMHHSASILCLQYDDSILVTGSSDSSCIVYSVKSGYRPVRRLLHHSAAVLDLCFDERYIVTCSKDVTICVWDRETGAMIKQLRGHSGPVNAVQMRGNTIVSCSGDFRVKLWNIDTGKAIRELTGHTKGLACSQFSEDGRFVASAGNDRVIRIWDANTGECLREMKAHTSLVRSLHIDSVSGRLISASYDRDIKVFDMETGQQLLDFPQWHQSWVLSAKSDYRRIISTGQDPKILVMDFGAGIDGIDMLETADATGTICSPPSAVGEAMVTIAEPPDVSALYI